ncbi:MAG: hypothetical protein WCF95_04550 [bacterium]
MNVNTVSFAGKSHTKSGNEYNKTNTWKIVGAIGGGLSSVALLNNQNAKLILSDLPKNMQFIKPLTIALEVVFGLGVGALIDHFVNQSRRNRADEAAVKQQKVNAIA